jgi:hypothetical protein
VLWAGYHQEGSQDRPLGGMDIKEPVQADHSRTFALISKKVFLRTCFHMGLSFFSSFLSFLFFEMGSCYVASLKLLGSSDDHLSLLSPWAGADFFFSF